MTRIAIPILALVVGLAGGVLLHMSLTEDAPVFTRPDSHRVDDDTTSESTTIGARRDRTTIPDAAVPQPVTTTREITVPVIEIVPDAKEMSAARGSITGIVVDERNAPVSGATIIADRMSGQPEFETEYSELLSPDGVTEEPPIEKLLELTVRQRAWRDRNRLSARSGDDGRFTVAAAFEDENYRLGARLDGYRIELRDPQTGPIVPTGSDVRFVALLTHDVCFDVRDRDGAPLERAQIQFMSVENGETDWRPWNRKKPRVALPPGTWNVTAHGHGKDESSSAPVRIEVPAASTDEPVILEMRGATGISFRIRLPEGERPWQLRVAGVRWNEGVEPRSESLTSSNHSSWLQPHENKGKLVIEAGRWLVGVILNEQVFAAGSVDVKEGMLTEHEFVVEPRDPAHYVTVRAYADDGTAIEELSVQSDYHLVLPRRDGSQWVDRRFRDGIKGPETESIGVFTPKYGGRVIDFDADGPAEITVRFERPATAKLRLDGYDPKKALVKFTVGLRRIDRANDGTGNELSNPLEKFGSNFYVNQVGVRWDEIESVWLAGPMQPGTYAVELSCSDDMEHGWINAGESQREFRSGENNITLPLPPIHSLTVLFEGAPAGTTMSIQREDSEFGWFGLQREIGPDGIARFQALPAGSYRLTAWGAGLTGEGSMRVDVTGTATVRYEHRPARAMSVTIRDANGYATTLGLRDGDLVVGCDGTEWADDPSSFFWPYLRSRTSVKLKILRGAAIVEVDADCKKLIEGSGATFESSTRP